MFFHIYLHLSILWTQVRPDWKRDGTQVKQDWDWDWYQVRRDWMWDGTRGRQDWEWDKTRVRPRLDCNEMGLEEDNTESKMWLGLRWDSSETGQKWDGTWSDIGLERDRTRRDKPLGTRYTSERLRRRRPSCSSAGDSWPGTYTPDSGPQRWTSETEKTKWDQKHTKQVSHTADTAKSYHYSTTRTLPSITICTLYDSPISSTETITDK